MSQPGTKRPSFGLGWPGLLLLLAGCLAALGSRAQPATPARALLQEVRHHLDQQDFNRATLPLYRRALRLARLSHNDTLLGTSAFAAGRAYEELGRLDSAALLLRQSHRASLAAADTVQTLKAANFLVDTYGRQARPDSVRAWVGWLRAFYPHTRPGTRIRDTVDGTLAGYYQDEGQYALALRYRLAQLAYRRTQPAEPGRVGAALANIGELFYLQGQLRQSLRYRREGLGYMQRDPTMRGTLPQVYGMLGKSYRDLGQLDSARLAYETALRLLDHPADRPDQAAFLHSEIGMVLGQQGQLALARQHCRQALTYCAPSDDLDGKAQVYFFAGDVEQRAGNYPAARAYLRQAYALARQAQSPDRLEPITHLLAAAEAATGHYAEAYQLRELSARLLDSAHVASGQQAMAAMEARYQNQDKQRQIRLLNAENRQRVAEAASQRRATYLALAGVAGLLAVLALIGLLLRQRQRTAALLAGQNATLAALNQRLNGSNAQLADANQAKAKLFSVISHDLRAPIGNLLSLLDLDADAPDLLDPATRQQQAGYLRRTARDLLDTLDELLAWSKDQLDYLEPVPAPVALPALLAELAGLYAPLAERKGVTLAWHCPPALTLRTDPNFLRVVLRNLVQNALKFTPPGGQVRLEAAAGPSGNVTLRVHDTGPGLDATQLSWLAAPTADPATAPPAAAGPAHGLGLRLSREFVAKLGGQLSAHSVPGQGSTLTVEL